MHFRRCIALVTGATAILASLVAAPVFAADSSGWHTNSLALTTSSVDGCKVQWGGMSTQLTPTSTPIALAISGYRYGTSCTAAA